MYLLVTVMPRVTSPSLHRYVYYTFQVRLFVSSISVRPRPLVSPSNRWERKVAVLLDVEQADRRPSRGTPVSGKTS